VNLKRSTATAIARILSSREVPEEEHWRKSKEIFDAIKIGDTVRGTLKNSPAMAPVQTWTA
jgi:hypothetical protein